MTDPTPPASASPLTAVADALHSMGLCRTTVPHARRAHEPDAQRLLDAARAAPPDAGLREALRFIADHGDEWTGSRAAYEAATALDLAAPEQGDHFFCYECPDAAAPAGLDEFGNPASATSDHHDPYRCCADHFLAAPAGLDKLPRCEHGAIREPCIPCSEYRP
jgi:hypothetical protein